MHNYNKMELKKKLRSIREDFIANDYYITSNTVITTDIYNEDELFLINCIAGIVGVKNTNNNEIFNNVGLLKEPYGLSDIANAYGLTMNELNERVLKNMGFVREV